MGKSNIILKLSSNGVVINGGVSIQYIATNLPVQYFKFKHELTICFEAEQTAYDKDTKTLRIRIIDYNSKIPSQTYVQNPRLPVSKLEFEKLDWQQFGRFIYSYRFNRIKHLFFNIEDTIQSNNELNGFNAYSRKKTPSHSYDTYDPNRSEVETKSTEVSVNFEEATFHDGRISFKVNNAGFNLIEDLEIQNIHLRKEFENIKPWFIKRIGKCFKAKIELKLVNGKRTEVRISSDEISSINEDIINNIRTYRILKFAKVLQKEDETKSVFTKEEVLILLSEENAVLDISDEMILTIFINKGYAKNVKQLQYLSEYQQSLIKKLQFTLKPHFGFLFNIESASKQYFIWELLNSHATYIWEIDIPETHSGSKRIEQEILFIRTNGRKRYKRYYKSLNSKIFGFHLIEHDNADLTEEQRFLSWRDKLESALHLGN